MTNSSFGYDIDDNRIHKIDDNGTQSSLAYVVDNNQDYAQVIHEIDNNTFNTEVSYTCGDDLLAQNRIGQLQTYHYDGLGSTRLLTDNSGSTTDSYNYEAFGDLLNQEGFSENNYLFTGEQYDGELDQYYLRARYYNQTVGRFNSMDSWMGTGSNPLTLNKYLYVESDSVNNIDPSGRFNLSGIGATLNIRSTLSSIQIEIGTSLLDSSLSNDSENSSLSPSSYGVAVLALGGSGFKLMKLLSKKGENFCNQKGF